MDFQNKLKEFFADHNLYHSKFQQDNFITYQHGTTIYGQYKQALRELYSRYKALKGKYSEKELLQIDIEESEEKLKTLYNYELRRAEIKLATNKLSFEEMKKSIHDTEVEFKRFYEQCSYLKEQLGELTPERTEQLDKEMWIEKMKQLLVLEYVSSGRLDRNTVEMVISFPMEIRQNLLQYIGANNQENINALVKHYLTYENDNLNSLEPIKPQDFKSLIEGTKVEELLSGKPEEK